MLDNDAIINQTKKWLSTVVIKHTLCPFAQREYDKGSIHYEVIKTADLESQLEHILLQCTALSRHYIGYSVFDFIAVFKHIDRTRF